MKCKLLQEFYKIIIVVELYINFNVHVYYFYKNIFK